MSLTSKKRFTVGIDLGVRTIAVSVAEEGQVVALALYEDPRDPDPDARDADNEILFEWLQLYVRENGLEGQPTVMNVPGEQMVILPASLEPGVSRGRALRELAQHPRLTAYLPFEDPAFTFWEHRTSPGRRGGGSGALWLASIPTSVIESRSEKIREAGLEPEWLEPDLSALARILPPSPDRTQILVDIGELSTQIGFVREGNLVFYRTLDVGVVSLLQPLSGAYQKNFYQVFHIVRQHACGVAHDPAVEQLISPVLERFWGDIARTIAVYRERCDLTREGELILLGGGSLLVQREQASRVTGLDIRELEMQDVVAPDARIQSMEFSDERPDLDPFSIAIGCSLSPRQEPAALHFRPSRKPVNWKSLARFSATNPLPVSACLLLLTLFVHVILRVMTGSVAHARDDLELSLELAQQQHRETSERLALVQETTGQLQLVRNLRARSALHAAAITATLSSTVPGVQILEVEIRSPDLLAEGQLESLQEAAAPPDQGPRFSVRGLGDAPAVIQSFLDRLGAREDLEEVRLGETRRGGNFGIPFTLEGRIALPDPEARNR